MWQLQTSSSSKVFLFLYPKQTMLALERFSQVLTQHLLYRRGPCLCPWSRHTSSKNRMTATARSTWEGGVRSAPTIGLKFSDTQQILYTLRMTMHK
jgi:hypothetical protein